MIGGNLYQEANKLKNEVNKRELHFLRTGDPRPRPLVHIVGSKIRGEPGGITSLFVYFQDVLIMYYAPWCGYCKQAYKVFLQLARFHKNVHTLRFAR